MFLCQNKSIALSKIKSRITTFLHGIHKRQSLLDKFRFFKKKIGPKYRLIHILKNISDVKSLSTGETNKSENRVYSKSIIIVSNPIESSNKLLGVINTKIFIWYDILINIGVFIVSTLVFRIGFTTDGSNSATYCYSKYNWSKEQRYYIDVHSVKSYVVKFCPMRRNRKRRNHLILKR